MSNTDINEPVETNVSGVRVAISVIVALIFVVCTAFLLYVLEGSLIAACNTAFSSGEASACTVGSDGGAKWSLDPATPRFPLVAGLIGVLLAGSVALMFLLLLPSELIKIDGTFKQGANQLRIGGVAAVFLLISAGGGYLAYRAIPQGIEHEIAKAEASAARAAAVAAIKAYEDRKAAIDELGATNRNLVKMISDKHQDYARALLEKGYFTAMRGSFLVFCDVDAANEASDKFQSGIVYASQEPDNRLNVLLPAQASNPNHVNFGVPMSRLGSDSFTFMTLRQDAGRDLRELMRTELSVKYQEREDLPDAAFLYLRNVIHQGQLADYCNRVAEQGRPSGSGNTVSRNDAPPRKRGG